MINREPFVSLQQLERQYSQEDETAFRALVFPEEDRSRFTSAPWDGGYRWFRSANVVPFERYRRSGTIT